MGARRHTGSERDFLQWLDSFVSKCPKFDGSWKRVLCMVKNINDGYHSAHRVIIYPQAFYFASKTTVVCFSPTTLNSRLNHVFSKFCKSFDLGNGKVNTR